MVNALVANYQSICENIRRMAIQSARLPEEISLVAVSKYRPLPSLLPLYEHGHRAFAESKVQELLEKQACAPADIEWHFIGNLQRNKVRKVVGNCQLIHSVDSYELALKISQCSAEIGATSAILLEVNTSGEPSKGGLSIEEWKRCFEKTMALPHLKIEGLMTMAPLVDEEVTVRRCFSNLRHFKEMLALKHLSMGMSQDYLWAVAEGATLVRIGSALFE